jgi:hypothetical protein
MSLHAQVSWRCTCRHWGKRNQALRHHVRLLCLWYPSLLIVITGMRVGWIWRVRRVVRHDVKVPRRLLSTQTPLQSDLLSQATRNIGIIAHIDAVGTLS